MTKILGISGSLRKRSFNTAVLRAMADVACKQSSVAEMGPISFEIKTLHDIPLYDGDMEEEFGIPVAVQSLGQAIRDADGIIICTPEYNHSIPGVLKNAVDWISRIDDDVFSGKPVALAGASPGGFGTILSQNAWLPVLHALETQLWTQGQLLISRAGGLLDDEGKLTDDKTREKLHAFVLGFADFAAGC